MRWSASLIYWQHDVRVTEEEWKIMCDIMIRVSTSNSCSRRRFVDIQISRKCSYLYYSDNIYNLLYISTYKYKWCVKSHTCPTTTPPPPHARGRTDNTLVQCWLISLELTSSEPGVSCCSDWDSRRGLELDTAPSVLSSKVTQPLPRTLVAVSASPITADI